MTLEQARQLRNYGVGTSTSAAPLPYVPSRIIPEGHSDVNTIEQRFPLSQSSFNNVPLADVASFRQFKYSDNLHRADAIAAIWKRGDQLNTYLRENGVSKFAHAYD